MKLFSVVPSERTTDNRHKSKQEVTFKHKKNLFKSTVKHWNRFPSDVEDYPSLETFETQLETAVSHLPWLTLLYVVSLDLISSHKIFNFVIL